MSAPTIVPGSWWFGRDWLPWRTGTSSGVTVGERLALLPNPDGPRSLRSANGTLGGLVLPPSLAVDAGVIWLLDRRRALLRRFDPVTGRFVTQAGWGRGSSGAHWFGEGASIAATGGRLAIADPHRGDLVVVATGPMVVRSVLRLGGRRAVAVAGRSGRFYVLDDQGHVHVTTPATERLVRRRWTGRAPAGSWSRIAVDDAGRVCLVDTEASQLLVRPPEGGWELFHAADEVRSRFPDPELLVDRLGRFRVPARFRIAGSGESPWFDAQGEPCQVDAGEFAGAPPYQGQGTWTSEPLDSGTLGCRWHRLTVTGTTPAGCTTTVTTYTSDEPFVPEEIPPDAWSRPHVLRHRPTDDGDGPAVASDLAVLSPPGRYLSLRVVLQGDGWATPSVDRLLVEPEAKGLERFLPAVYRGDDQETDFLRRFLAIFGTELDEIEHSLRSLPARFAPRAVPEPWLNSLAAELGVPLERGWSPSQRRAMLEAGPRWHRFRGTPAAVGALLRAHLQATVNQDIPESLPVLVEGFRERPTATVGGVRLPLGAGVRTWSDEVVDRPVLGSPGRRDRISLVSVGDRLTDRFRVTANRFKVVVPSPLLPDAGARESFERLIAAEKPAHVAHELVMVEPRAIVGGQGLLGVDTFVGAWPLARLAVAGCRGTALGLGLQLAARGPAVDRPPSVGRGGRVGVSTVLI
jgi:phage tail-like protein